MSVNDGLSTLCIGYNRKRARLTPLLEMNIDVKKRTGKQGEPRKQINYLTRSKESDNLSTTNPYGDVPQRVRVVLKKC